MIITPDNEVDIFVASRIGSFKHVKYHTEKSKNSKKCIENLVDIKTLQKDDGITCLQWGNEEQTEILVGRKNQQIQIYSTTDGITATYSADFAAGHVVGLGRSRRKLLAATASGVVRIWSKKEEFIVQTGGKLDTMKLSDEDSTLFATVLVFFIRLYDTRVQRRPVVNVEFTGHMPATCIVPSFDERQVLVGFGRGQLHQVDLRVGRQDKGYKGAGGAITSIAICRRNRLVVSASLDRHLRIHEHASKDLLYKQYLTSKLSAVLVQSESTTALRNQPEDLKEEEIKGEELAEDGEEIGDDLDALFDRMETIGEKSKKKLPISEEVIPAKMLKPSTEGSTVGSEEAIAALLRSTEKQKRKRDKKKREKKAKSVFHNA